MSDNGTLLRVENLRTYFRTDDGLVRAVDGVSFRIARGQTFALVGESGCGKSVTAYSILGLLQSPPALVTTERWFRRQIHHYRSLSAARRSEYLAALGQLFQPGQLGAPTAETDDLTPVAPSRVTLEGKDVLGLPEPQMRRIRGREISMIFQEPMSSLNPVFTCGSQIVEAIRLHRRVSGGEARRIAVDLLGKVGIPDPARRFGEYPHQLSGGMRQRAMIAMALSCNPKLLIADEPTTALDVTIQAQILELLGGLISERQLSILLITHDLAVVAETADAVGVMYASRLAELTDVGELFGNPLHPYTAGLFRSLPRLGERKDRLDTIPGTVPNPLSFPTGCKFHPRCPLTRARAGEASERETVALDGGERALARCVRREPTLREVAPRHWVACWECAGYEQAPQTNPAAEDKQ